VVGLPGKVIQGTLLVADQVQSLREAVTGRFALPPVAPTSALDAGKVKVHGWPGGLTVNEAPAEVAPPACTLTVAAPAVAMTLAGTKATNCVALTKLVMSAVPFHSTTAPEMNPVPFTVSVKSALPAAAVLGVSEVIVGGAAPTGIVMLCDAVCFVGVPLSVTVTVTL
jgi:hypothetical protein